jgi:agmatinase
MQFLELQEDLSSLNRARFVVLPLPYDGATSWMAGARLGPRAIIEAYAQMELWDEETGMEGFRQGIHTLPIGEMPLEPQRVLETVRDAARQVFDRGKILIGIGGDHSVSIGTILEAFERYGPLDILQLDAHTDLRQSYQESTLSHACAMRRVWHCGNIIQAGIRSMSRKEHEFLRQQGAAAPIFASMFHSDEDEAIRLVLKRLSGRPLYITIDVDCLDPSEMPATGTPEPGGLSWHTLIRLLRKVVERGTVVGFDLVELSPIPGLHFPQFTAARLIYKIINYMACGDGRR